MAAGAKVQTAIGLMSGTSCDGVDAAILRTDGERIESFGAALTVPYPKDLRDRLRRLLDGEGDAALVARDVTLAHADAVRKLLDEARLSVDVIDVVGFHGHTVSHRPTEGLTRQIGDAALLAETIGIDVVADFRSRDVAAGGQGAPLVPVFHAALVEDMDAPLAVLNVGGVANVTWIGRFADGKRPLLAFDTGPGNALIDDWAERWTGQPADVDGALAAAGTVDDVRLSALLSHPFFAALPPKSLDRNDFAAHAASIVEGMSAEDGAATLTAFSVRAAAAALGHFPEPPVRWLVCGGGRHNPTLMEALRRSVNAPVEPVEAVGWNGDALEAQAFAYLAVRSRRGLTLTFPETTGARRPVTGGALHRYAG